MLLIAGVLRAGDSSFEVLRDAYAPYMSLDDPYGFPMKVRSMAADPYKFWRGSKDLFFIWCRANAADWLNDRDAYIAAHGDLHLGNIGTYATGWQKLAFGAVDLDDAIELPFQIEMLQGVITLELIAAQNGIELDPPRRRQLVDTIVEAYANAIRSGRSTTELLSGDATVKGLLAGDEDDYAKELKQFTRDGQFRERIGPKKKPKELLRRATDRKDAIAEALARAVDESPYLRAVLRYRSVDEFRGAIRDVALRTRLGSSGSQGLKKYLVLMDKPLAGVDSDAILYLKQEIPAAAQRAGVVAPHVPAESPGQRVDRMVRAVLSPPPYLSGSCELGTESFWITLKEPWSSELDSADVSSFDQLLAVAKIWGTVAGASHALTAGLARMSPVLERLNDGLTTDLLKRSEEYRRVLGKEFSEFSSDPNTQKAVRRAEFPGEILPESGASR